VTGNCYFSVGYADNDLVIPMIQTLVYVGPEEDAANGRRLWTFREMAGSAPRPKAEDDVRCVFPEEQLYSILDLGGLIRTLTELAPEHPVNPVPPDPGPASQEDLHGLKGELERFFASVDMQSVTITIRFTDDGLSLTRRPDGRIDLLLFPHSLEPDREAALRALCLSSGLTPAEDYLSDRGRTRVLVYPLRPGAELTIAGLTTRMFLDVYHMRRGDTLIYRFRSATSQPGGLTRE
jgi:hypothetical protein